jgi:hypothetical protein
MPAIMSPTGEPTMPAAYEPFRNLREPEDLLLVRRAFTSRPRPLRLPADPYYGEFCGWVSVAGGAETLFSSAGQTLFAGTHPEGHGWRLCLTPYGYLRFETMADTNPLTCESPLPVHCIVDADRPLRLGVALNNYAWLLRGTDYAEEAVAYHRVRLLVGAGEREPFTVCGAIEAFSDLSLAPVPRQIVWETPDRPRFTGTIREFAAYNTDVHEMLTGGGRDARRVIPIAPGGGGFGARWTADDTIEVFPAPEFSQTSGYWFLLPVADRTGKLRRLRLRPIWHGGTNMTPSFFASRDGHRWRRVAAARVQMRRDGREFAPEITLTAREAAGCTIASAIPFLPTDCAELLEWAAARFGATVQEIGRSVEGRPLHALRLGPEGDGVRHVAIVCGQHSPAETMGGHLLRPLLAEAQRRGLLQRVAFHFVPTVNVDCAHYGGNGLNANRRNTNRHWFEDIQPENRAVIDHFLRLREAGVRLDFALDVHAGGTFRNHVLMPMGPTEEMPVPADVLARQEAWCERLERLAGLRRQDGWPLGLRRWRATDWFFYTFGCQAFCLELSTCSYFDPEAQASRPFDQRALTQLGRHLAAALDEGL